MDNRQDFDFGLTGLKCRTEYGQGPSRNPHRLSCWEAHY